VRRLVRRVSSRLAIALSVLLLVFLATFAIMRAAPGGPFQRLEGLPPEVEANLAARYGLDQPLAMQFLTLLSGVLQGDFGPSLGFAPGQSVASVLARTFPVSLELGAYALLIALLLGGTLGIAAGSRPGSLVDRAIGGLTLMVISASVIVLATLVRSWGTSAHGPFQLGGFDSWHNKTLPSVTLGLAYAALIARLVRANVATSVSAHAGRGAAARGVLPTRILWQYVLPGALVPMLSYLGSVVAAMLTGSFVVESIFEVPGVAACFVSGANARDYPLVMAAIMVYTTLLVGLNLLCESLQTLLDPRLRDAVARRER
jgi:oligopeptide transport system permease protein